MSLETAYFIAQIIAALAVVASLVFVGLQVRANTREQAINRVHQRAAISAGINGWVATDSHVRAVLAKAYYGLDELTLDEFSTYMALMRQALILLQLSMQQVPGGPLNMRSQSAFPALARLMSGKGFGQYWAHFSNDYPEPLCERIDEIRAWASAGGVKAYPGRETAHTAGGVIDDA